MLTLIFRGEAGRCPLIYILFTSCVHKLFLSNYTTVVGFVLYVITYIALLVCFVVGRRLLSYHVLGSISVLSQNTVT